MNEIVKKASDAQALASDPMASAFVSANAGTGKTKLLTDRVLRLLLEGAVADGILCVTYTRAAAAEMRNRIANRLAQCSLGLIVQTHVVLVVKCIGLCCRCIQNL